MIAVALLATLTAYATTYHTINVSNGVSDFATYEKVADTPNDTIWTSELNNVYLTWDATDLFIGMDFDNSGDNGYDFWISMGQGSTCTDAHGFGWQKRVGFSGWNPDYVVYTWPSSSTQLYGKIQSNSPSGYTDYTTSFTAYGGQIGIFSDCVALKFPWVALGGFSTGQVLRIAFTLTGANWSAGDIVPDPTDGPYGGASNDIIDNFFEINCDEDSNGVPDEGYNFSGPPPPPPLAASNWELYH